MAGKQKDRRPRQTKKQKRSNLAGKIVQRVMKPEKVAELQREIDLLDMRLSDALDSLGRRSIISSANEDLQRLSAENRLVGEGETSTSRETEAETQYQNLNQTLEIVDGVAKLAQSIASSLTLPRIMHQSQQGRPMYLHTRGAPRVMRGGTSRMYLQQTTAGEQSYVMQSSQPIRVMPAQSVIQGAAVGGQRRAQAPQPGTVAAMMMPRGGGVSQLRTIPIPHQGKTDQ